MSYCQGNVENCTEEEFLCYCGIMCCIKHGHVDFNDEDYECPNEVADPEDPIIIMLG